MTSRQVAWWPVHELVAEVLDQVGDWPLLGTPAWCALDDDDPRKWAALLDAAQHWALRLDVEQEARAEASRAIAGAADWRAIGGQCQQRAQFRASRPWSKRVPSS